jgi:hypothetical protein
LSLAAPPSARAEGEEAGVEEEADALGRLQTAIRTATELCGASKFQEAEHLLLGAIQDAVQADLDSNPALVSAHGVLGLLYSRGIKDDRRAVEHFKQALRLNPDLKLNKSSSTPEADKNFARAWAEIQAGDDDAPSAAPVDEASVGSDGLICPASAQVQAGDDVTLRCLTTNSAAAKVTLSFKPAGQGGFRSLPMASTPSADGSRITWTGRIPGSATAGQSLPYFIEARDKNGTLIARLGAEASPNLIAITGSAQSDAAGSDEEPDDTEQAERTDQTDDHDPLARHREARRRERGSKGTGWFSLAVGTGFGWAKGGQTEAFGKADDLQSKAGLAWASLGQAVPEIGYFLDNNWALSVMGRLQYVPTGQSLYESDYNDSVASQVAKGAWAALLRLLYFGEEEGGWRFYGGAAVGGGEGFRFRVTVPKSHLGDVKDTQRGGPLVAGLAGGALCRLGKGWQWVFETGFLVGFPDSSAVLDLNTGIRAEF